MLAKLKARLEALWHQIDGDARAELERIVTDAEAEAAKFAPLVATARTDIEEIVKDLEPEVKAAVGSRLGQLAADVEAILKGIPGL